MSWLLRRVARHVPTLLAVAFAAVTTGGGFPG